MRVRIYKRTNRHFKDIYTRNKETKAISISTGKDCVISITEHQFGSPLRSQHIDITTGYVTYSMNMDEFMRKITGRGASV